MRWLVSVPVWGERCVDEFCAAGLPALDRAIAALPASVDARLIVHTDQPERVVAASSSRVEPRPVPAGSRSFDCMSQAHREVLGLGLRGDSVVLLTAGSVVSEQALVHCLRELSDDRARLVMCASPRVCSVGPIPDTGDAQALMDWAWANRHPMADDSTWPSGRSRDLSRVYFVGSEGLVVTRQALPHPLAVRIDGRQLRFTPTIDANLMHCFHLSEIRLITECSRLAVIKLTASDRYSDSVDASIEDRAHAGLVMIGNAHQRWCVQRRITLSPGSPDSHAEDNIFETLARGW